MRQQLRRLAWLLDSSIPIPGTGFTVGLDAVIGLFPFVGDLVGVALSSYILREAARAGAPRSVLLRMGLNIAVDGLIGLVPIAGDVFDAAFKANRRNVRLLEEWLDEPRKTRRVSRVLVAGLVLAVLALIVLVAAGVYALLRLLFQA